MTFSQEVRWLLLQSADFFRQSGLMRLLTGEKYEFFGKPKALPSGRAFNLVIVELRGFEPLASSMPWKRATNCAIAPLPVNRLGKH